MLIGDKILDEDSELLKNTAVDWIRNIINKNSAIENKISENDFEIFLYAFIPNAKKSINYFWSTFIMPNNDVIVHHKNMNNGAIRIPGLFSSGISSSIKSNDFIYSIRSSDVIVSIFPENKGIEDNNKESKLFIDSFAEKDSFIETYDNGFLISIGDSVISKFIVKGNPVMIFLNNGAKKSQKIKLVSDLRREIVMKNEVVQW